MVTSNETFRVSSTKSGRVVLESPSSANPTALLTVTESRCFLSSGSLPTGSEISSCIQAHAVVGLASLCYGRYVLLIQNRVLAGTIQSHKIWKVTKGAAVLAGVEPTAGDSEAAAKASPQKHVGFSLDQDILKSLLALLSSGNLYYSPSYDMTHSLQHNHLLTTSTPAKSRVDDRFFFNKHLSQPLLELSAPTSPIPWVTKLVCGFAGSVDVKIASPTRGASQEHIFTVTLVSRVSTSRLGTRYIRRGLDLEGNAANSVEMEQIVFNHDFESDSGIASYLQVRGSAPLVWKQERDMRYQPVLTVVDVEKAEVWASVEAHLEDLKRQYGGGVVEAGKAFGKVICVDLLDTEGFEAPVSGAYAAAVEKFGDDKVAYQGFPVNKYCRKMDYSNMQTLVDRVTDGLVNAQVFVGKGSVPTLFNTTPTKLFVASKYQTGVARVSCLDSLDRTNLTCTLFARHMLPYQLLALTRPEHANQLSTPVDFLIPDDTTAADISPLQAALEAPQSARHITNLWADSGDAISLLYAGTRALRGDITRTGKRDILRGNLADGANSLTRYYLNNFVDGKKQDALDLWTGHVGCADDMWRRLKAGVAGREKPWLNKKGVVGVVIPGKVIDAVEPALQVSAGFLGGVVTEGSGRVMRVLRPFKKSLGVMNAGSMDNVFGEEVVHGQSCAGSVGEYNQMTLGQFVVTLIKLYLPDKVGSFAEFLRAGVLGFYVLVMVKVFGVKGAAVVDRPRLSEENRVINELMME
ncbi:hypothetical protein HDU98_008423 [Podochytrium sp. JEL0797]|nr:hypothetical protein HDU98_008423 [Podochytrium sp. JEL0797]